MSPDPEPAAPDRRLVIASNRLPVTVHWTADGRPRPVRSSGGLAAAMAGVAREVPMTWVGWPGADVPGGHRETVRQSLAEDHIVPVFLDQEQEAHYYRGICNEVLWPLCHYFTDKVEFVAESWEHYLEVNRLFADAILDACGSGPARVWVHDFHLTLVPGMLRERRPDLAIGFFLHIPFPSSEIYRLLPTRAEVLEGMLGADYIGFHTSDYALHFRRSCLRVLGLASERGSIEHGGRHVGFGADPIGIDVAGFRTALDSERAGRHFDELAARYRGTRLLLGVERLDYSKGVPHKLAAFERFLERDPSRARHVRLLQLLVPSRTNHPDYDRLKDEIERQIGHINGRFGAPGVVPIEYMYRTLPREELAALYRFAEVALITPLRDGMNLVAQEFVACQRDLDGRLVLSEFAGASQYLSGALLVNPWDTERMADTIEEALSMSPAEAELRMRPMQDRVESMDCQLWARRYLHKLDQCAAGVEDGRSALILADIEERLCEHFEEAPRRSLLLDYDGTLREITKIPQQARPTDEINDLLRQLAAVPATQVHVISGRDRDTLGAWLGDLPVHLCAEHGFATRRAGSDAWVDTQSPDLSWLPRVRELLEQAAEDVPNSFLEVKAAALAWHYRMADLDYGMWRARELQSVLDDMLANEPAEVLHGSRVIEVRPAGVHKGTYVRDVLADAQAGDFVLCAGDDRTDEDMFRCLPPFAVSIQVGNSSSLAVYSLPSPSRLRALLRTMLHQHVQNG